MNKVVLDASALLALLNGEPGSQMISRELKNAEISAVTLAEVVSFLVRVGMPGDEIIQTIDRLGIMVHSFARNTAFTSGLLEGSEEEALNLSDRACVALALQLGAPIFTVNPKLAELEPGIPIKLVRVSKE